MIFLKLLVIYSLSIVYFNVLADNRDCGIQNVVCKNNDIYRSIDGTCNNKKHPNWGTINSTYIRFLPAKYGDGVHSFPLSISGKPLPNARNLTVHIHTDGLIDTCEDVALSAMTFGQGIAHDLSFTLLPRKLDCCTNVLTNLENIPKECANIKIPKDDPYYSYINATCLPMLRTYTNKDLACQESTTYADQVSNANNFLDLSIIYGHTYERHKTLRTFKNGTLLVEVRQNKQWPPSAPRNFCQGLLNFETKCYRTGDPRFVQNPQLTITHILWIREHNRIAAALGKLNPLWNDNKLFQVARSIAIAEWQHICYYELLPLYAGYDGLLKNKILFNTSDDAFVNDYDENQKPHIYNEFAHAAWRQFHSIIEGKLGLFNPKGCQYDALVLRDHMDRPVALEKANVFDSLIRGLSLQSQKPSDIYFDPEITRGLFLTPTRFGQDLRALDVHRSRDHGLPSYNDMRKFCGLPKAKNFNEFLDVMTQDKVDQLRMFYNDVNDVDLIVGGTMETNVKGTLAGPTYLCIIYKQFHGTRRADRYWYENAGSGFTPNQLREIRKAKVSKIFCNNGNYITQMQRQGFLKPSDKNPRIRCTSIEGPNLILWKE